MYVHLLFVSGIDIHPEWIVILLRCYSKLDPLALQCSNSRQSIKKFFKQYSKQLKETHFLFFAGKSLDLTEGYSWESWTLVFSQVRNLRIAQRKSLRSCNLMLFDLQAFSGLVIGAVMKHSSNLTRLFIISSAMILTTFFSVIFFGIQLNLYFVTAFALVSAALVLFYDVFGISTG